MNNTIKFSVLVKIDRSGHGTAFLKCAATGHLTGSFPISANRFPTPTDMAAKALEWATTRRNIDPAHISRDVEVKIAA